MDATQQFVQEPHQIYIERAGKAARQTPSNLADVERAWERNHPEGRATYYGNARLVLWNFEIGSSRLKPEHRKELEQFIERNLYLFQAGALLLIDGFASASGAEAGNRTLSQDRAASAAMLAMMDKRVPGTKIRSTGEGERTLNTEGDLGEALAKDRRVDIAVWFLRPGQSLPEEPLPKQTESPTPDEQPFDLGQIIPTTVGRYLIKGEWSARTPAGTFMYGMEIYVLRVDAKQQEPKLRWSIKTDTKTWKTGGNWSIKGDNGARSVIGNLLPDIQAQITTNWRIVIGERSAIGFRIANDVVLEVEYKWNADVPITFAVTIPPGYKISVSDFDVQIASGKIRVGYWPSPQMIQRMTQAASRVVRRFAPALAEAALSDAAAAAAPAAGAAALLVGTIVWFGWSVYELVQAHEEGELWGLLVQARHGYAAFIACAVGQTASDVCRQTVESVSNLRGWRDARELGWELAAAGWDELANGERTALRKRLNPDDQPYITPYVMYQRIFPGTPSRTEPLPHPRALIARKPGD